MRAMVNRLKGLFSDTAQADGSSYALAELAKDPGAAERLTAEAQDMFGEHGWYPFNVGMLEAVGRFEAAQLGAVADSPKQQEQADTWPSAGNSGQLTA